MDSRAEIKASLSSIEFHLEEIKIFEYFVSKGIITDRPYDAARKFREFKTQFEKYNLFFDEDLLNVLNVKLKEALGPLTILDIRDFWFHETTLDILNKTVDYLEKLPNLKVEKFNYSPDITIQDIINLLPDITERSTIIDDFDVENNLKKIPKEIEEEGKKLLIELHNTLYNEPEINHDIIHKCSIFFEKLKERNENELLNKLLKKQEELQETNIKLEQVKTEIGLISTDQLVTAFKNEANSQSSNISTLTSAILFIFICLIFSAILILFLSYNGTSFIFPKNFYFYSFYISFIVISSGLLTYLIKERTRIVNYQNYCNITYLEIIALIEFTAQLNDKVKAEDLKIKLAERYFKGPNLLSNSSETSQDNNLITSKLSEVSKTLSDLKSTLNIK